MTESTVEGEATLNAAKIDYKELSGGNAKSFDEQEMRDPSSSVRYYIF